MAIVLGPQQYGKAEVRVVRVIRDTPVHQIRDLCVSTSLRGDFAAAHLAGDQSAVLPTDSQKNTVFAFAKERPAGEIEDFALALARHFVTDIPAVTGARVEIDEYAWDRIEVDGAPHDHSFVRRGQEVRTTIVTVEKEQAWVTAGIKELVLLKSTGSEFHGFYTDPYTTLPETSDRILATALIARWRYARPEADWAAGYAGVRSAITAAFATVHSLALQQTLYAMGEAALLARPEVAEIRFSAPNKHHFAADLAPFGLENPGEVFYAADRPYGLIEATVTRDDAPDPGLAWYTVPGSV
ncbi:MAG TPA: urate oxidase [Streptosporangiaceae bacterium]|jgi:urate oxidase